jgi:hypothetical protein
MQFSQVGTKTNVVARSRLGQGAAILSLPPIDRGMSRIRQIRTDCLQKISRDSPQSFDRLTTSLLNPRLIWFKMRTASQSGKVLAFSTSCIILLHYSFFTIFE